MSSDNDRKCGMTEDFVYLCSGCAIYINNNNNNNNNNAQITHIICIVDIQL